MEKAIAQMRFVIQWKLKYWRGRDADLSPKIKIVCFPKIFEMIFLALLMNMAG